MVKVSESNQIVNVSLNRVDARNAFNAEMIAEITNLFRDVSRNMDLRGVVLSGEGPSFCAGADLNYMKSMAEFSEEENLNDSQELFEMFQTIYRCPHPVIGKVHGHVMGGGLGLVAVCDIVASQKETKFAFSEVKLGLVPAVISSFVLKKVSQSAALEVMLTGEVFNEEKAKSLGLVQFVGHPEEVEDYVLGKADMLRASGKNAVKETKRLIRMISEPITDEVRELTVNSIASQRVSAEGQEGLSAFFEKRKPSWKS